MLMRPSPIWKAEMAVRNRIEGLEEKGLIEVLAGPGGCRLLAGGENILREVCG